VEVQSGLANTHHLIPSRKIDERFNGEIRVILGLVGVDPDGGVNVRVAHGYGVHGLKRTEPITNAHHQPNPGGAGPSHDLFAIGVKLRRVEVYMAVDEHAATPSTQGLKS
jgi:hypothetical protein